MITYTYLKFRSNINRAEYYKTFQSQYSFQNQQFSLDFTQTFDCDIFLNRFKSTPRINGLYIEV